jgi:hypothetical protein
MNKDVITDKQLIALAGKGAFERRRTYFNSGAIVEWQKKGSKINKRN